MRSPDRLPSLKRAPTLNISPSVAGAILSLSLTIGCGIRGCTEDISAPVSDVSQQRDQGRTEPDDLREWFECFQPAHPKPMSPAEAGVKRELCESKFPPVQRAGIGR